jgi:hypothetical protein
LRQSRSRFDQADLVGVTNIANAAKELNWKIPRLWFARAAQYGDKIQRQCIRAQINRRIPAETSHFKSPSTKRKSAINSIFAYFVDF